MELIFERSRPGRGTDLLPPLDVPECPVPAEFARKKAPRLPEIGESDLSRHYQALARRAFGVCDGFYPLGSCTMKYNPKLGEDMAALPGFTGVHPLQPAHTIKGCQLVMAQTEYALAHITGMDRVTLQPAAGAHGEFTGLLLIKAYHVHRGDTARTVILVPDSAHGTNPASAAMAGFTVRNIPSTAEGLVDLEALKAACGPDTAGLMLTNPNTVGLFERDILEITKIVHEAGGLVYYDGANLNAIMGVARPGDMGFDVCHLNLHKTFATPHGGGGPGSGPVGCKEFLAPFMPGSALCGNGGAHSIGQVRAFHANFLVVVNFYNMEPTGKPIWSFMFITVACGAISGFHATQSPLMARCMKSERQGHMVFYGAMVCEGIIALIWAAAGCSIYEVTNGLNTGLQAALANGQSAAIYDVCAKTMGGIGVALAMLGVIACPITSGDTAFRSARLTLADWFKLDQEGIKNRLILCVPLLLVGAFVGHLDYSIVWRYFSWTNQTLAMIVLWAASMYLFQQKKNYWITAVPATFMSAVSATYFLLGNECLGQFLNTKDASGAVVYNTAVAYPVGIIFAVLLLAIFIHATKKQPAKK